MSFRAWMGINPKISRALAQIYYNATPSGFFGLLGQYFAIIMSPLRGSPEIERRKAEGEIKKGGRRNLFNYELRITNYELRGQNHNRLIYK